MLGCETSSMKISITTMVSSVEMGFLEVASSDLCQDLSLEDADRVSYYLDCVVNQFGTEEYPLKTAVVRGKPAESILEYIEEQQIDLVAIATHGYGGLKRWTYGSVTEKILRKADCAMLVVRPPAEALN